MRLKLASLTITTIMLIGSAWAQAQETKPTNPDPAILAAGLNMMPCTGSGDGADLQDCKRRETARLFLIVGKPKIALRILCNTNAAIEAFRSNGSLTDNKYDNNFSAYKKCLQTVNLEK